MSEDAPKYGTFEGWKKTPDFGKHKANPKASFGDNRWSHVLAAMASEVGDSDETMLWLYVYSFIGSAKSEWRISVSKAKILRKTGWGEAKYYDVRKRCVERRMMAWLPQVTKRQGRAPALFILMPPEEWTLTPKIEVGVTSKNDDLVYTGATPSVVEEPPAIHVLHPPSRKKRRAG